LLSCAVCCLRRRLSRQGPSNLKEKFISSTSATCWCVYIRFQERIYTDLVLYIYVSVYIRFRIYTYIYEVYIYVYIRYCRYTYIYVDVRLSLQYITVYIRIYNVLVQYTHVSIRLYTLQFPKKSYTNVSIRLYMLRFPEKCVYIRTYTDIFDCSAARRCRCGPCATAARPMRSFIHCPVPSVIQGRQLDFINFIHAAAFIRHCVGPWRSVKRLHRACRGCER
jgi:hypothetical protein